MKPLEGTRVLTVESFGAAPYGSMFLADLGADVIKIENAATGGDASRGVGPHMLGKRDSQYFQAFNLNKRSITLNLKSREDYGVFLELVATAEAVVNNLRGDQPEKLGLDYASLKPSNSAIVCLHISAYGRDNSRKNWPGYDYLMQAEAGIMSVTGEPEGPPSRMGVSIIDHITGLTGMVGLLSCILKARETGEGCDVDASLFDVALHQLSYSGAWFLNSGEVPGRMSRSAHLSMAPVQTQRTSDGWIYVMCMTDKFWQNLVDRIDRPELKSDRRFATAEARRANRDTLTTVLDEQLSTRTTAEWLEVLSGALPVAPILDVDQAFANPFVAETGMVETLAHPEQSELRFLANPLKLNGERLERAVCSSLGADNASVFSSLASSDHQGDQ